MSYKYKNLHRNNLLRFRNTSVNDVIPPSVDPEDAFLIHHNAAIMEKLSHSSCQHALTTIGITSIYMHPHQMARNRFMFCIPMSPPSTSLPTSAADFPADLRSAIYQEFLARAAQNIGVLPTAKTLRELSQRMPQHRVLLVPLWRAHGHREDEVVAILRHANEDQDINIEALLRQSRVPVSSFTAARDRKREALAYRLVGPAADPCMPRGEGGVAAGTAPIAHAPQPAHADGGVAGRINRGAGTGLASRVDIRTGQGRGEAADALGEAGPGVGVGVEGESEGWGGEGVEQGPDGALDSAGLGSTLEAASAWAREGLRARTEAATASAAQRQREEASLASSRSGWSLSARASVDDGTPFSPLPRASSLVPVQMPVPTRSLTGSRAAQRTQRAAGSAPAAPEDAAMRARVRHNLRLSGLDWPPQPEPVREDPLSKPLLPPSVLAGASLYRGWYGAVAREGVAAVAGDDVDEVASVNEGGTPPTSPSSPSSASLPLHRERDVQLSPRSASAPTSAPVADAPTAAAVAPRVATPLAEERAAISLLPAEALPSSVLVAAEASVDVGARADAAPPVLASAALPFSRHQPLALVVHTALRADSALPFPQPSSDFPALHARTHPSLVPSSAAPTDDALLPATLSQQHWPRVHQALSLGHISLTAPLDAAAPSQEVPRTEHARARARLDAACLTWVRAATDHAEATLQQFATTPTALAAAVREGLVGQLPGLAPPPPALNRFGEQAQLLPMPIFSYQRLVRAHPHIELALWPECAPQKDARQPGLPSFATSVDPVLPASLCSLERTRTRTRHGAPGPRAGTLLVQPCVSLRRYLAELATPPHVSLHTAQWLLACAASGVKAALEAYNKGCGAAACVDVDRTCGLLWSVLSHRDVATVTVLLTHYVFKRIAPHGHNAPERPGSRPDTASTMPPPTAATATPARLPAAPPTPPTPLPYTAVSEKSLATSILLLASTITDALRQPWVPVPTLVLLPLIADCIEAATTSALAVHYSELFRAIPWPAHVVITSAVDALLVRVLNRSLNTYDRRGDAAGTADIAVTRTQRMLSSRAGATESSTLSPCAPAVHPTPALDASAHKRAQAKALASAPVFVPPSTAVAQLGGVQSLALSAPQLHMLGLLVTAGCDRLHALRRPETPLPSPLAPALLAAALPDLFPALLPACLARMHALLSVLAPLVAGRVGDDSVIAAATHQALCTDLTQHTHAPDNPLALPLLLLSAFDCSADRVPLYARSHTWAAVCAAALEAAVAMVVVERIGATEEARVRARGLVAESHVWSEWSRVCADAYTALCERGYQPPAATTPTAPETEAPAVAAPAEGEEEWDWLELGAEEFGLLALYGAPARPAEAMAALLRVEAEGALRRESEDGGADAPLLAAADVNESLHTKQRPHLRQSRVSSHASSALLNTRTATRQRKQDVSGPSESRCGDARKRADTKVAAIIARHEPESTLAPVRGGSVAARAVARAQEPTRETSSASSQTGPLLGARADYYKLMQRYSRDTARPAGPAVDDKRARGHGRPDASALAQVGAHLASQHAQRYSQMNAPSLLLTHMRDVEE